MGTLELTVCLPVDDQSFALGSVARDGDPRLEGEYDNKADIPVV